MKENTPGMTVVVLVFILQDNQAQREKMNGIYSAAIRRGWQIQPVNEVFSRERLQVLRRQWAPVGCLIDATAMPNNASGPKRINKSDLLGLPTVLMGRDITRKQQTIDCSAQNPRQPMVTAIRKFRELGLNHFAFVGDPNRPPWSIERGEIFKKAVKSWKSYIYQGGDPNSPTGLAELSRWLKKLAKPVGVFLAADHLAMTFYRAGLMAKLTIGEELFAISVDNDERICTSLAPTLSSIRLDFFQAGHNAITLLGHRIENPNRHPCILTYGTIGLVERASTARPFGDHRISRAVNYITEHCCEHIDSETVASKMGCCRRLAEKLFKRHVGATILGSIRELRLKKAKSLLENTQMPIDTIPSMCGYQSLPHMKTLFRKSTGMTMREWRKSALQKRQ